jgi:hypothetical protein
MCGKVNAYKICLGDGRIGSGECIGSLEHGGIREEGGQDVRLWKMLRMVFGRADTDGAAKKVVRN